MKGIVFNLLEEIVSRDHGEDTWDALLDAAGLEGSYTAVGSYPDGELAALVKAAASALNLHEDEVVKWFGKNALPLLHHRYPAVFEGHKNTKSFVLTLNDVIHPEVRKLFPGAYVPEFEFSSEAENRLSLSYTSRRRLCSFAEGLIEGAANHFGEEVTLEHALCMKRGDQRCLLECTFRSVAGRGST